MAHLNPTVSRNNLRGRSWAARLPFIYSGRATSSTGQRWQCRLIACTVDRSGRFVAAGLAGATSLYLAAGNPFVAQALADQLVLTPAVERNQSIEVFYRFETPLTGQGFLDIEWSDVLGRVVERRHIPLDLTAATAVTFALDTRRAVAMKNQLMAHISFDATDKSGGKSHR